MDDLISRQAVIDAIYACYIGGKEAVDKAPYSDLYAEGIDEAVNAVEELPSVSTEKTGRWIRWYEVIESADGKSTDHIPHCKCSECNCEYDTYSAQFIKYCPNCGARMIEPQERKGEE